MSDEVDRRIALYRKAAAEKKNENPAAEQIQSDQRLEVEEEEKVPPKQAQNSDPGHDEKAEQADSVEPLNQEVVRQQKVLKESKDSQVSKASLTQQIQGNYDAGGPKNAKAMSKSEMRSFAS